MTCDFIQLATPGVQRLTPYVPGKPVEELERELGIANIIKLASNENPLGPSPKARQAITEHLDELTRYPDGNGFRLKQALSKHLKVTADTLTLGNGSNDILDLLARAYLTTDSEAVYSEYAFAVYPIAIQAVGAKAQVAPALDYGHDLAAMRALINDKTRLVFIANPNNPTGTWLNSDALQSFIASVPEQVLVVVDEAYFEYVEAPGYASVLPWLDRYPNLVVTRTFSKAYGLAALRVGYSVSHPDIANVLNRVRNPFNVDVFALAAAEAVLQDQDYLQRSLVCNRDGMAQLEQGCRDLGLSFIPSVGNFISVQVGSQAAAVYQGLLHKGVIVRPLASYAMPEYLRITVGTSEENARCLSALGEVLDGQRRQAHG